MTNKQESFVSAVVYVKNDALQIEAFVKMLTELLKNNFKHSEIIFVNDFSTDESISLIKKSVCHDSGVCVSILNMSYFQGLEACMNAGCSLSIGDFVYEFDSVAIDYEPEQIIAAYNKCLEGFDSVSARPNKQTSLSSSIFYFVFKHFSHLPAPIHTERFRIMSRRFINQTDSLNRTVPYRKAVYASSGLKMFDIVYEAINDKKHALTKKPFRYRADLAINALLLFTNAGYRFSGFLTFGMMSIALFMLVYAVVVYLTKNPVAGWTTTILFLSTAFFGLFALLTVIIKYLQIIMNLVFKQKHYNFESIEKLTN